MKRKITKYLILRKRTKFYSEVITHIDLISVDTETQLSIYENILGILLDDSERARKNNFTKLELNIYDLILDVKFRIKQNNIILKRKINMRKEQYVKLGGNNELEKARRDISSS